MQPHQKWGGTDNEVVTITPVSGLSATNGQVYRQGRICAVQLRLSGNAFSSGATIATGFPKPYTRQYVKRIGASGADSDVVDASGNLVLGANLAQGDHYFSCVYLIAE